MRLIDIEPFETEKDISSCQITRWHNGDNYINMWVTDTKDIPSIDAVPVVRCKDCKQFMEFRDSEKEKQGCDGTCYRLIMHCFDNDFAMVNATDCCSWGVKRDA